MLVFFYATILLCYHSSMLPFYYTIILQCYNSIMLLFFYTTILLYYETISNESVSGINKEFMLQWRSQGGYPWMHAALRISACILFFLKLWNAIKLTDDFYSKDFAEYTLEFCLIALKKCIATLLGVTVAINTRG